MKVFSGRIDLHCHSDASDGVFAPEAVVQRAHRQGVGLLSLTDHDTMHGVARAQAAARRLGVCFLHGLELSTVWAEQSIHVVGLNLPWPDAGVASWLDHALASRRSRAREMAARLEEIGFVGAQAWVEKELEKATASPSRANFARWLLAQGFVGTYQEAFDRWLGEGKPAYVQTEKIDMADGVRWIRQAGGISVLAHPGRYRFSEEWMRRELVRAFYRAGGQAIEISSGSHSADWQAYFRGAAQRFNLWGSTGSDWHSPQGVRPSLGHQGLWNRSLAITPVWEVLGYRCQDESIMY